jgi:enoyl-[acyl-carrier-protein] reductase (NADH)
LPLTGRPINSRAGLRSRRFWLSISALLLLQSSGVGRVITLTSIGSMLSVPHYHIVGSAKAALESAAWTVDCLPVQAEARTQLDAK